MDDSPIRSWTDELSNLLFPRACPGCGEWDVPVCAACARAFAGAWMEVSGRASRLQAAVALDAPRRGLVRPGDAVPVFPVWSLGEYEGARRAVILRWKNVLDASLSEILERRIRLRGRDFAPALREAGLVRIDLVPAPSRPARKRDGLFVAGFSARAFAQGMREEGIDARLADVLATRARRGARTRQARALKATAIRVAGGLPGGVPVVVVDDVLTTGATLLGCARALEESGAEVAGALVLAAACDPRGRTVAGRPGCGDRDAGRAFWPRDAPFSGEDSVKGDDKENWGPQTCKQKV